jgi:hypothetical protein
MSGWGAAAFKGIDIAGSLLAFDANRKWEERKIRHQYRWAVDDLRKAGLNPIMLASGGIKGASGGASSQLRLPETSAIPGMMQQMASAKQMKTQAALNAEKAKTEKALRDKTVEETGRISWDTMRAMMEIPKIESETRKIIASTKLERLRSGGVKAESELKKLEARLYRSISDALGEAGAPSSAKGGAAAITGLVKDIIKSILMKGK